MKVVKWQVPISADHKRSVELESLTFDREGLKVRLKEEDYTEKWDLLFRSVQGFRCTTEESSGSLSANFPHDGAFFEVTESGWLKELGRGQIAYMDRSKHFALFMYDEVVEVAAEACVITKVDQAASHEQR